MVKENTPVDEHAIADDPRKSREGLDLRTGHDHAFWNALMEEDDDAVSARVLADMKIRNPALYEKLTGKKAGR
ncbi:MAG: hypothetical protein IT381_31675 [Deltaproteobacteria bacterium]|nr:hypothetical protein [Deltaproteobacteria bacterium]